MWVQCLPSTWGNNTCSSLHRWVLLFFAAIYLVIGFVAASTAGDLKQKQYDKKLSTLTSAGLGNAISEDVVRYGIFAGLLSIGAAVSIVWHCMKWNVVTRFLAFCSVGMAGMMNTTAAAFYIKQLDNETGVDSKVKVVGLMGLLNAIFSLILVWSLNFFAKNYYTAKGQVTRGAWICAVWR